MLVLLKRMTTQQKLSMKRFADDKERKEKIKKPKFFNIIGEEQFDKIKSFVIDGLEDSKIEIVFIEAKAGGMGKTRLAREIAARVVKDLKKEL